jgi:hypothetical protein
VKARRSAGDAADDDEPEVTNTQLTPLQLQVKRRETERQTEMRMHSHAYLKQREEEEKWVELQVWQLCAVRGRNTIPVNRGTHVASQGT